MTTATLAQSFVDVFRSQLIREVVSVVIYPAIAGAVVWAWQKTKAAMNAAICGALKEIGSRLDGIEDEIVILQTSNQLRGDMCSLCMTATFEADADGRCIAVGTSLAKMFGMEHDEMLGWKWMDGISTADERKQAFDVWMSAVKSGLPYRHTFHVTNRQTGETFICEAKTKAITGKSGKVIRYFGTVTKLHA